MWVNQIHTTKWKFVCHLKFSYKKTCWLSSLAVCILRPWSGWVGGGERMMLFFQRKFVNCLLKQIFRIGRKLEEIVQNAKKGCSKYEKLPKSCRATCGKPQERASSVKTWSYLGGWYIDILPCAISFSCLCIYIKGDTTHNIVKEKYGCHYTTTRALVVAAKNHNLSSGTTVTCQTHVR